MEQLIMGPLPKASHIVAAAYTPCLVISNIVTPHTLHIDLVHSFMVQVLPSSAVTDRIAGHTTITEHTVAARRR